MNAAEETAIDTSPSRSLRAAERERVAWQIADQRYNQIRGVGGGNR